MCKVGWWTSAVLFTCLILVSYKFVYQGDVKLADDGRVAILLDETEKTIVLSEMRALLNSVQQITEGINKDDMELIAEAASRVGWETQRDVPGTLQGKLPISFKKLGSEAHRMFDQIALDAKDLGDKDHVLVQLGQVMTKCVSCHAIYKIEVPIPSPK